MSSGGEATSMARQGTFDDPVTSHDGSAPGARALDLEDLLNPDEQRRFRRLCIDTPADDLDQMAEVIQLHLDQIKANATATTDVETAELVAEALLKLLSLTEDFDADERSMVRGAIEYFILHDDASDDLDDALGFDDDARVLNSVLGRIGRPELQVTLAI